MDYKELKGGSFSVKTTYSCLLLERDVTFPIKVMWKPKGANGSRAFYMGSYMEEDFDSRSNKKRMDFGKQMQSL